MTICRRQVRVGTGGTGGTGATRFANILDKFGTLYTGSHRVRIKTLIGNLVTGWT